jgi:hypothetical protein
LFAEKDCLFRHKQIESPPNLTFPIQSGLACSDYCKYLNDCIAFSFELEISGMCSLYQEQNLVTKLVSLDNQTIFTGEKKCYELVEFEDMSAIRTGEVYIRQWKTGACLSVSSMSWSAGDDRLMIWEPHCRAASLWLIEYVNVTTGIVRIKEKESGHCVTVMPRMYQELHSLAVVKECFHEEEEKQIFMMPPLNVLGNRVSWYLLYKRDYKPMKLTPTVEPDDDKNLLTDFNLVQPTFPCTKLSISHGRVLLDPSQPLYLPRESIPILCDPGYGMKKDGEFLQYFTTTCSDDLIAPECVTYPVVGAENTTIKVPALVFYSVIVVVVPAVVLMVILVACTQRRRILHLERLIKHDGKDELEKNSTEIETKNISN